MINWFLLALIVLTTWRVTHLITDDQIPLIARPREWIVRRNPDGALAYLVECTYCVSVYTGALAAFALWALAGVSSTEAWFAWPALGATTVALEKGLGDG